VTRKSPTITLIMGYRLTERLPQLVTVHPGALKIKTNVWTVRRKISILLPPGEEIGHHRTR
jgi:hypothetical protein